MAAPTRRELRKFGIAMAVFLGAIATIRLWRGHPVSARVLYALVAYALLSLAFLPAALRPTHWLLMKVAHALGWFNTRLILILLFYVVFTPIGLLLRLFGKDLLSRKIDRSAESYWNPRPKEPFDKKRYERQF
ncbi:MAG: hypothetical protein JW958_09145 [Candidatus Eisenbacteria bacterium]|nr:hypothetical protein [Candidatus Eisenbacteria bacterium]